MDETTAIAETSENPVHPHESIWIPLPDGTRLAARLWRPAVERPVGAVIEWIPYRQSDATAVGDTMMHGWFAAHGLAALRIDIRGSGNSDGTLTDEYLAQEQDDAVAAIAWIAAQPWCNGSVGMIGISWGGFAALQVAARRPPALKAIVTCCSTDDRWSDDVHYMGGALLNDGVSWGSGLFAQVARPPDPAYVGDRWRDLWLQRLNAIEPPLGTWLAHPERDAYWRHGSVAEDYGAIDCAVMAVGGWTDGYSDAVLRLMQHLKGPRRGLIGPWTHVYPNFGLPGPAIGFLQECLRWWRQWLDEEDGGEVEEPLLVTWIGEELQPDARDPHIGGRWVSIADWPRCRGARVFEMGDGLLAGKVEADAALALTLNAPQDCGVAGGEWCPLDGGGNGAEFQSDQRGDDGLGLAFDSAPLSERVETLGAPILSCGLSLAGPATLLAIRLCEVAPDGTSARVTFGLHRLRRPAGVAPGERFSVTLPLKAVGYAFTPGRRIRVAVSDAYWPMAWPEAERGGLVLYPAGGHLTLPLLGPEEEAPPLFEPPAWAPPLPHEIVAPEYHHRTVSRDLASGETTYLVDYRRNHVKLGDLLFGGQGQERYRIRRDDPASAETVMERSNRFERPGLRIRIETSTHLRYEGGGLRLDSSMRAFENDAEVFSRVWEQSFPKRV